MDISNISVRFPYMAQANTSAQNKTQNEKAGVSADAIKAAGSTQSNTPSDRKVDKLA